ncbi:MAG: hypothetical protein GY854_00770 [Deltaproteobacteria bacterium]|nr:hypothetical protein [Deltaproteobacteria bacterium]
MDQPVFDAAAFVAFDLKAGMIFSAGKEPLALVPLDVLETLAPGSQLDEAAHRWGSIHGTRLASTVADSGDSIGIEVLAEHVGGTIAALGMGRVSVEVYGDALMFRAYTEGMQQGTDGRDALLGGFLAGFIGALTTDSFDVLMIEQAAESRLFWAGNPDAVKRVRRWIEDGIEPLAAIGRLSKGSI